MFISSLTDLLVRTQKSMYSFKSLSVIFIIIAVFAYSNVYAIHGYVDEIVVTGTAVPSKVTQMPTSATVISNDEIEEKKSNSLEDLLRGVPQLQITSFGQNTMNISIRGAISGHALVLVDGQPYNDVSGLGAASIAKMPTSSIERIEIVSGPASSLYGNNAMSGVINIITKKDKKSHIYFKAGNYYMYETGGSLVYNTHNHTFSVGASHHREDGLSSAMAQEKDSFYNTNVNGKYLYDSDNVANAFNVSYFKGKTDMDLDSFTDENSYTEDDTLHIYNSTKFILNNYFRPSVDVGHLKFKRKIRRSFHGDSDFTGHSEYTDIKNEMIFGRFATIVIGSKIQSDRADLSGTDGQLQITERYGNAVLTPFRNLTVTGGGRYTDPDKFKDKATYSAGISYRVVPANLTLRAAAGSAYMAPSMYQLSTSGLEPEYSEQWEAGFTNELFDKQLILDFTYFNSRYADKIAYDMATMKYYNVDSFAKGVEAALKLYLFDIIAFNAGYVYTDSKEDHMGIETRALKVPLNRATASIAIYPLDGLSLTFEGIYTDKSIDKDFRTFPYPTVTLEDYMLYNFYVSYDINEDLNVNGKVMNISDKKYYTTYGYNTKRINFAAGMELSF